MRGRADAAAFAAAWAVAWNARDLDAVLAPFADDATFTSPLAARLTGDALVRGRAALRDYWKAALEHRREIRFEVGTMLWDETERSLAIFYRSHDDEGALGACELMRFDARGRQIHGEAYHGARAPQ